MSVLVSHPAPDFTVPAVLSNGELTEQFILSSAIKNKYGLLFFYPLDFTFVCPSELIALDHRIEEFQKRNIEVVAVSIDSHYTHLAWRNTPVDKGGIGPVRYTIAADMNHDINRAYGVEHPLDGVAFRAAFLIDSKGVVRSEIVNDLPIGRNVDEILRLFDAIDFTEKNGEVCPANWKRGEEGMTASPAGVADYLAEHGKDL